MFRRKIDHLLSEGEGKQLAWLTGLVLALFGLFCLLGRIWGLDWSEVLTLYLDAGNFPIDNRANDAFSLIVAVSGLLLLSAILISVFSNVMTNIAEAYRNGEKRYRLNGHVLILGGGRPLAGMLKALRTNPDFDGKDIVVMAAGDVKELRGEMETALDDARFCKRIVWYRGERDNPDDLASACAASASAIYLIGEDGEDAHDAVNLATLDHLDGICGGEGPAIPCFVTLGHQTSQEVLLRQGKGKGSQLGVEIVHTGDYCAELLLVDTPFLPALDRDDPRSLHVVIAGSGPIARSFARVAAGICHFPNFKDGRNPTRITFVDSGMKDAMDRFVAHQQPLFDLSHYRYVTPDGVQEVQPREELGDFMDIRWEFMEGTLSSPFVREKLADWATDPSQALVLAICHEDADAGCADALHLPQVLYDRNIPLAVYLKDNATLLEKAEASGQFGALTFYGEASPVHDALLLERSLLGKRVNYLYDLAYGNPPASSAEAAWARLSHAHKLSSIDSANSIPLKMKSFHLEPTREAIDALDDETLTALSEVEHRRWMASMLLMGYRAAPKALRSDRSRFKELKDKQFIHLDIAPYDEIGSEDGKDMTLVKNLPYVMTGDTATIVS